MNKSQRVPKFKSEGLEYLRGLLKKRDYMTKKNIKNEFFHVEVKEEEKNYLGFRLKEKYYRYTVLLMGSATSPFIFQTMLKPIVEYIRDVLEIRIVWYIDDFLIMAESLEKAQKDMRKVVELCTKLGWKINFKK
jgi:hypothetical protein